MQGKAQWDQKYPSRKIEAKRKRNVKQAANYEANRLARHAMKRETRPRREELDAGTEGESLTDEEGEMQGTWAAVDGERPPPSSIAARRDTVRTFQSA